MNVINTLQKQQRLSTDEWRMLTRLAVAMHLAGSAERITASLVADRKALIELAIERLPAPTLSLLMYAFCGSSFEECRNYCGLSGSAMEERFRSSARVLLAAQEAAA